MRLSRSTSRGSLTLEQAMLIAVIVAALIGSAVYVKRGLMGKYRGVGDAFGFGRQHRSATLEAH